MTYNEFRALVEKMRAAQRRYFRERDNLAEAKTLERAVDEAILLENGPSLFREPPEDTEGRP